MHWEKEIRIRITIQRIVITVLAASAVANLVIVGAVVGAEAPPAAPTATSVLVTPLSTNTFLIPVSGTGEVSAFTQTPGITPTDIFTPTPTSTDSPISIVCIKRFYWPAYQVQPGDTLFFLAILTGSTVNELASANCLSNYQINAGQLLYVPRVLSKIITPTDTLTATQTSTTTVTPTNTLTSTLTNTPTETPTATATNSPTSTTTDTPSPTPTDTPTETPTPTATNFPTVFQNPKGNASCQKSGVYYLSFSVLPVERDGVSVVNAIYKINTSPQLVTVSMGPDGATYYGSGNFQGTYTPNDTLYYRFEAIDLLGDRTQSSEYRVALSYCP